MDIAALRRAFRARPRTAGCNEIAAFLTELTSFEELAEPDQNAWRRFVSLLECDVIPVVSRCHPTLEVEEISSLCVVGAFEGWVSEWLRGSFALAEVRRLAGESRYCEAWVELSKHPRFHRERAERATALWQSGDWRRAVQEVEGSQSARSYFITRARTEISESQRKQRRRARLMTRHCLDTLGLAACRSGQAFGILGTRSSCGAELERDEGGRQTWRVSALPPAHLLSQELVDRLRRMLGAIQELGPDHERVFKLLLEGLSQRSIARVEGRHPAAISRRVRNLQDLCRAQLLDS
jgi:RNA polymerase sigma factor (sigma-70 family)